MDLKPCPFCGETEDLEGPRMNLDTHEHFVKCNRCGGKMWSTNDSKALIKWNTRPIEEELHEENEKLKQRLEAAEKLVRDAHREGCRMDYLTAEQAREKFPDVKIGSDVWVAPNARIGPDSVIGSGVVIASNVEIESDALIESGVVIEPDVVIRSGVWIRSGAWLKIDRDYLNIGPIGHERGPLIANRHRDGGLRIYHGRWVGTLDEFEERVNEMHSGDEDERVYRAAIRLIHKRMSHLLEEGV